MRQAQLRLRRAGSSRPRAEVLVDPVGGTAEDDRPTREVKLAVFFAQDKLNDAGYPVRDRVSSSYIATFEPAATFGGLVKAEGIRRRAGHVCQPTIIGDGAAGIRGIATIQFPEATQIVDLYQAQARERWEAIRRNQHNQTRAACLTSPHPKMIFTTYESGVHPPAARNRQHHRLT